MDSRAPLGAHRPRPPNRTVSGPSCGPPSLPKRPTLPSRLSTVRSVSFSTDVIDLTTGGIKREWSNNAAYLDNRDKVCRAPDIIKIEDEDGEPPLKKTKIQAERLQHGEDKAGKTHAEVISRAHERREGSPMPLLPKARSLSCSASGPRHQWLNVDVAGRKANGLKPPPMATRVPPLKETLEFWPWTGNHPEDVLTENVIKAGFFDKGPAATQAESNSARQTIWPNLAQKNHPAFAMLTYLYTQVMEKRQAIGRCTAPSSFKPPPRVTVTDTKREAWLRDLANPEVPLRKQSRTIPHGVRGKVLMEQCLSKEIPLQRAVWLAKCVGANELRGMRRKGVSGTAAASAESKWVRDWTTSVEQSLESVIASCGQPDWQHKINYAVKLITSFYSERLLELDHYLDWLISSFAEATLQTLPIWLLLAQLYWKDLVSIGRRGRRLAEAILEHLSQATETKVGVNCLLKGRLQKLVAILAVTNRGCLILPRTWTKYKGLLTPRSPPSQEDMLGETPAHNIQKRNERLARPLIKTSSNTRSALMDLYTELDVVPLEVNVQKLAERCSVIIPDASRLVPALLDWAATRYRVGTSRTYIAARLIGFLRLKDEDTDGLILQYLGNAQGLSGPSTENIHKVIAHLIHLEAFSIGRCLRWLITSGVLSTSEHPTCASSLIATLPTSKMAVHLLNTRNTIMRRLGYPATEQQTTAEIVASIEEADSQPLNIAADISLRLKSLTSATKTSVACELVARMATRAKNGNMSINMFCAARDAIESLGDICALGALVAVAIGSENILLLAIATDTVLFHAETFVVLGDFRSLVDELLSRYHTVRSQQPLERALILALAGLLRLLPDKAAAVRLLQDDLNFYEQQHSLAVCSPASDSLVDIHTAGLESEEDLDAVFASGNTMDEHLMQRVFVKIIQRANRPVTCDEGAVSKTCAWLNQLRLLCGSVFDQIVDKHLRMLIREGPNTVFQTAITSLVASNCLSLEKLAEMTKESMTPKAAVFLVVSLVSGPPANCAISPVEKFHFRAQQKLFQDIHADSLVALIRSACDAPEFDPENADIVAFLIRRVVAKPNSVRGIFDNGLRSDALRSNTSRMMKIILEPDIRDFKVPESSRSRAGMKSIVHLASPLSIPYSVGNMRFMLADPDPEVRNNHYKELQDTLIEVIPSRSEVWPQLLEFAGEQVNRNIRDWAQDQLLLAVVHSDGDRVQISEEYIHRCLDVLAVTSKLAGRTDDTTSISILVNKLKELEKHLTGTEDSEIRPRSRHTGLLRRLRILLHLCSVHVHDAPTDGDALRQAKGNLLTTLCSLLVHQELQTHYEATEFLFDLCSTLSDSLPTAMVASIGIPLVHRDSRLKSILGVSVICTETGLALTSQFHPPGSQQQRALNKHPSQQPQLSRQPSIHGQMMQSMQQQQSQLQPQRSTSMSATPAFLKHDNRGQGEVKMTPYHLRTWEIMPDSTPVMGENDASLSLGLFGARKV